MRTPDGGYIDMATAESERPTGVYNHERILLRTLMPLLGDINLLTYYQLRISCCARMLVEREAELGYCQRCHENRGFVCPSCLGARYLRIGRPMYGGMSCHICMFGYIDSKGKTIVEYDPERELAACNSWLARNFPLGVPLDLGILAGEA